ncbi:MAG: hypothetical protein ACLR6J_13405 [Parabacteroides merdae]
MLRRVTRFRKNRKSALARLPTRFGAIEKRRLAVSKDASVCRSVIIIIDHEQSKECLT